MDDRDLICAAKSDRDAFAALYLRHADAILGYFARVVGRSDLAYDLTAETFASILTALPSYRTTEAPGKSWLYAIAHRRLVDSIRQGQAEAKAREQLGMQALVLTDDDETTIDRIIARLDGRSALQLVNALPAQQRDALISRFLQGRDYAEIAAEMRCSEQVARQRVSRGLARLRTRMRSSAGNP